MEVKNFDTCLVLEFCKNVIISLLKAIIANYSIYYNLDLGYRHLISYKKHSKLYLIFVTFIL